jgi:WD40 repeat protein
LIKQLDKAPDPEKPQETPTGHRSNVLAVVFHPLDNNIIASGSYDKTARIWNISNLDKITSKVLSGHSEEVYSVAFAPGGRELATSSLDNSVRIWDPQSGRMLRGPLTHRFDVWRAIYGKSDFFHELLLITASWDQAIHVFAAETFQRRGELTGHTRPVRDVAISKGGRWIASGSSDRTARLWDLAVVRGGQVHAHPKDVRVTALAASPTDPLIYATGAIDGVVRVWNVERAPCPVRVLADGFLPPGEDSTPLGPGSADNNPGDGPADVFAGGRCREPSFARDRYNPGDVLSVAFDATGKTLFAAYQCGRVIAWDISTGIRKWVREPDFGGGSCAYRGGPKPNWRSQALSLVYLTRHDQLSVMVYDREGTKKITRIVRVDAETGKDIGKIDPANDSSFSAIAAAPSGEWLAVSEQDLRGFEKGRIRLIPIVADGSLGAEKLLTSPDVVERLAFDSKSSRLAGAAQRLAFVWQVSTSKTDGPAILQGHEGKVEALSFDQSGGFLFTVSDDESIRVWDLKSGGTIVDLSPHVGTITSISINADSTRLITGSVDQTSIVQANLLEYDRAKSKACSPDTHMRRALTEDEIDRMMGSIQAADARSFLSFYTIIRRDDLKKPLSCPG